MSDPAIALLDAASTMLDVLTFYQERIASEGYLRTATERRSILELARLVGYSPRPGVASTVYLAYTLDDNSEPVEIPAGARAQSIPEQDALPQSFETSQKLEARKEWNDLQVRRFRPQLITAANARFIETVYFEGTEANLKPNDPILFTFRRKDEEPVLRKVKSVEPVFAKKKTKVTLQLSFDLEAFNAAIQQVILRHKNFDAFCVHTPDDRTARLSSLLSTLETPTDLSTLPKLVGTVLEKLQELQLEADEVGSTRELKWIEGLSEDLRKNLLAIQAVVAERQDVRKRNRSTFANLLSFTKPLSLPASLQPAGALHLSRGANRIYDINQDTVPQILSTFNPSVGAVGYKALANAAVTAPSPVKAYALRLTVSLFGSSAPRRILRIDRSGKILETGEPKIVEAVGSEGEHFVNQEDSQTIHLDASYDKILPGSWIAIDMSGIEKDDGDGSFKRRLDGVLITETTSVAASAARAAYGIVGKSTRLGLKDPWCEFKDPLTAESRDSEFQIIRRTVAHAQSEDLSLADAPIGDDVCGSRIELGSLYDGLQSGRWIIVSGERTDIPNTSGIRASELAMLSGIEQSYDADLPGDKIHSTLILANKLAYTYKRDTVNIYGNVLEATHGETRQEVLGSGDASQALQAFTLKQPPLTYVSAPTTSGIESTLHVRINDVEWKENDSLAGLSPQERSFVTKTNDEAKTTVIFGDGEQGSRLPTGVENVTATYRSGIGKSGNVKAGQISLVLTKPLGVKEVINPLRASGGADKETRDDARRNAPLAVMALDRLVSTKDYADFARTFAGIGKASAVRMSAGGRQLVHLTIAGVDDISIDVDSGVYRNLGRALSKFGDPYRSVQIGIRELLALVIAAKVRILPEYSWETVAANLRTALLEAFSFERRELGQSVYLSEVISAMQSVRGVAYVDVDKLDSISETEIEDEESLEKKLDQLKDNSGPNKKVTARLAHANPVFSARDDSTRLSVLPAQVAYLLPRVPDTVILNQIEEVKK